MNTVLTALPLFLAGAIGFGSAHAQAPLQRENVRAQVLDAVRTGDLQAAGDSGMKLNELYPDRYPKAAVVNGKSRDEVQVELAAALRSGDIVVNGDPGTKANKLFPRRFPSVPAVAGKTREQVRAETVDAIRRGDIEGTGDVGLKLKEQFPQRYAAALADDVSARRAMALAAAGTPASGH